MVKMPEDDSTARIGLWWEGLTKDQRTQFRGLEAGDPFPKERLTAYSRASLVADTQRQGQQGVDHRVNTRLGAFLGRQRGEQT